MDSPRLDATFLALADPTRRAILGRLMQGEASVGELAEPFASAVRAKLKPNRWLRQTLFSNATVNSGTATSSASTRCLPSKESIVNAQQLPNFEVTTPNDRDIVITRSFNAKRDRVFSAFTEPSDIRRWLLGPDGWSMPICEVDLRPGGKFHYRWRNDENGVEFGLIGTYREVEIPVRIVYREDSDEAGNEGDATVTTTFAEQNGLTTVTMTSHFDSRELRDKALESGMVVGTSLCFDRLENIILGA